MDKWRQNAEMYAQLLTDYLRFNVATFPKYYEYTNTGMIPTIKNYTSNIFLADYGNKDYVIKRGTNDSDF